MNKLIGRQILVKRGRLVETMVIENIEQITDNIFSVSGSNSKRKMVVTMLQDEIELNLQ